MNTETIDIDGTTYPMMTFHGSSAVLVHAPAGQWTKGQVVQGFMVARMTEPKNGKVNYTFSPV